jgi:hypothetical protein
MLASSVIVGAAHVKCVGSVEPEHDSILIVDAHGVLPFQIAGERVQSISGRHPQVVELRHGIDLIEFAADDRPQVLRDPAGRLRIDPVPDVPG